MELALHPLSNMASEFWRQVILENIGIQRVITECHEMLLGVMVYKDGSKGDYRVPKNEPFRVIFFFLKIYRLILNHLHFLFQGGSFTDCESFF